MPHPLAPGHLNQLNLKVLKRHCPQISDIYDQASYVVLYRSILKNPDDPTSKEREWSKKDVHVEGSMFLVEYDTEPHHGFYILNREGLSDFKHVFRAGDKIEYKDPFIIFQGEGTSEIWGLWIFEPDQRERISKEFLYYHKLESNPSATPPPTIHTPGPSAPIPASSSSTTHLPNGHALPVATTIDELFSRLTLPAGANSMTTPTGTPLPQSTNAHLLSQSVSGSAAVPRATGRRRGESVSAEQPYVPQEPGGSGRNIMTAASAQGSAPQGKERRKGKGGVQRPRSVPPGQNQQTGTPAPQVPNVQHNASSGLAQILGISPNPNPSSQYPPISASSAPAPALPPFQTQLFPRATDIGPSKNGQLKRKSTQYIPKTTANEAPLVDAGVVCDCLVGKIVDDRDEEKEPVSQRDFVQEVLRLIHTDKEWTKGLYEAYLARLGAGD